MYLNKVFVIGNLTRDPELKSLPSGTAVTNFGLATNRVYNDKEGRKQESTEFHNIVVFGRQAETVSQYLKKGSMALIEGRIQTRSWEQDGEKKYRTEIIADSIQFGPRGGNTGGGDSGSSKDSDSSGNDESIEYPNDEISPDDIPF